MFKDRWNSMNSFRRRVFAVSLAAAVATTTLNVGSLAVEASNNVRGREIVAFEALPEDVADQKLPIGGKKSDLNLPDELDVLLYTEEAEEEESSEGVQKLEEDTTIAPAERPSEQPSETEEETPSTEAPSEENRTEEQVSSDSAPADTETEEPASDSPADSGSSDTEDNTDNEDTSDTSGKAIDKAVSALKNTFSPVKAYAAEPEGEDNDSVSEDESAEEPSSETPSESREPESEETVDRRNSEDRADSGNRGAVSLTDEEEVSEERSEEATEEAGDSSSGTDSKNKDKDKDKDKGKKKVSKLSDGEEVTLTEVRWKLDRDKSQYGSRFQAVQAGDVFYFVPDIWAYGLKTDADLPEIKVTIVEDDGSLSSNSVSEDEVSGNGISENSISENSPAFDQFMIVGGVKVSVTAPEGVFPEDATLKVRKIDDAESNAKIEQAVKEDMGLSDEAEVNGVKPDGSTSESEEEDENGEDGSSTPSGESLNYISFDITITDVSGNEIQPNTEYGKANVTFSQADIVSDYLAAPGEETEGHLREETNEEEDEDPNAVHVIGEEEGDATEKKTLRVYHFDESYGGAENLERNIDGNESSVSVEVDHFSPFTLGAGTSLPVETRQYKSFRIEYSGVKLTPLTGDEWRQDHGFSNPPYWRDNPEDDNVVVKVEPLMGAERRYVKVTREGTSPGGRLRFMGDGFGQEEIELIMQDVSFEYGGFCVEDFRNLSLQLNNYTYTGTDTDTQAGLHIKDSNVTAHFNGVNIDCTGTGSRSPIVIDNSTCNLFLESDTNTIKSDYIQLGLIHLRNSSELNIYCKDGVSGLDGESKYSLNLEAPDTNSDIFYTTDTDEVVLHSGKINAVCGTIWYGGVQANQLTVEGGILNASANVKLRRSSGNFQIKGGTHVITSGATDEYTGVTVTGGSIDPEGHYNTINTNANIYYKLNFGTKYAGYLVKAIRDKDGAEITTYGLNDTYVDANGFFHFWPTGAIDTAYEIHSIVLADDTVFVNKKGVNKKINTGTAGDTVDLVPYNPITQLVLDPTYMVKNGNILSDFSQITAKDGTSYAGTKYPGGTGIPGETGFANNFLDIHWWVASSDTGHAYANQVYAGGPFKLDMRDARTCVLKAKITSEKDPLWTGEERVWTFFIPEYKAVSDIKSSAGTDPVVIDLGKSFTNAKNSSKKYTLFDTEYTVDPQEATAVADNSTNWSWEITTPDGITNDLNMGNYTPNQLGKYTLKATIPNGISEIPVKNFEKTFSLECKKSISALDITITVESPVAFKGKGTPVKAQVIVKDGTTTLTEGTDYTLEYSDNTDVTTTAKVTITGKGNYYDSVNKTFTIAKMPVGTITVQNLNLKFDTFQTADQVCKYVNGETIDTTAVIAGKKADGSADITGDDLLYIVSDKFYSTANELLSVYPKGNAAWKKQQTDGYAKTVANKKNYIYAMIKETDDLYTVISTKQITDDRIKPKTVSINSASVTGTTGTVTVQGTDEFSGIGAYYVLAVDKNGGTPPSSEKDIVDRGTKSTSSTVTIPNLSYANKYTFYAVVEDKAGNLSDVIKTRDSVIGKGSLSSKITVDTHSYDKLQGKQEIDDYYKEPKEIKITATADNGVKKIEYFISDKFYSSESAIDAAAKDTKGSGNAAFQISSWATYNDSSRPYLVRNKLNYIYVRVTDNGGFTYYISSKGIWEDEIVPKVTSNTATPKDKTATGQVKGKDNESGIKYYYTLVKKDTESAPKKPEDVKSAGTKSEDGKYDLSGLTPNTKYVIYSVIEDKAGNLSEIKVTKMTTKKDSSSANKAKAAGAGGAGAGGAGANGSGAGAGNGSNVDKRTAGASGNKAGEDSSAEGIRDGVPYIEDASDGIKIGRAETSGWDRIEKEVGKAAAPAQVFINMNGSTEVPAAAFDRIKDRDITCYYIMNDDITWAVNGLSFTNKPKDIDFRVRKDTKNIPSKLINEIADVYPHTNLTLEHQGEFGFTGILTVDVGKDNSGLYANLYYYDEPKNSLDFEEAVEVDGGGRASFEFLHASDYTVIIRGDALTEKTASLLTEDISSTGDGSGTRSGGPRNVSRNLGNIWLLVVSIICFLLCGLILFMPDRNKRRRRYARA